MQNNHNDHRYDDMLGLPHHVSPTHPQMSALARADQFSAFAALSGYDDAVKETARLTDAKPELDEDEKARISERLNLLQEQIAAHPTVTITYFQPDKKKDGGAYVSTTAPVKKIDQIENIIKMMNGEEIPISNIIALDGKAFGFLERYP